MEVITRINIDLSGISPPDVVRIVQGDTGRILEMTLFNAGEPWIVPVGASGYIAWMHKGYAKKCINVDGVPAVSFSGNVAIVTIPPQLSQNAGGIIVAVVIVDSNGDQITTFPMVLDTERNPALDASAEEDLPEEQYNQILSALAVERARIDLLEVYVTPQMYGATGDGAADDTAAIQAAIDSGKPVVIPEGVYLTTTALRIGSEVQLHSYGEIKYTGADYAVILDNASRSDVHFNKITASNGSGLKLHSHDSKMCAYNNITVGEITAKGTGILTLAEYGNQYNEIRFTIINADICIDIQCSATGWNTETKWYGGHMGGNGKHATYAIKAVNTNGGNVTTHRFYNVGFEGVVDGCILEKVKFFVFQYPRTSESIDNKVFILRNQVHGCVFRLSYFMLKWLDYSEHTGDSNGYYADINTFSGVFINNSGANYRFSYFEIWKGKMYNCNQKTIGYRNINEDNFTLTLDAGHYDATFPQELLVSGTSCVLDTRYYHSGNINTVYACMSGDANSTTEIRDSEGKIIAKVADYPWKKIKLTAMGYPLSAFDFAPTGWLVEVLE